MLEAGIDHLVLGCTHYPLLIPMLKEVLPPDVQIVDCGPAVARQTSAVLERMALMRPKGGVPVHKVFTTGDPEIADQMLRWMGHPEKALQVAF